MSRPDSDSRIVFSVSELNASVRQLLEHSYGLLWVEGEISNLARPRSGHLYFSLKDGDAQVRAALFRGKARLMRTPLADGDQVRVRARVSLYAARGDYQLIVEHVEPAGDGALRRNYGEGKPGSLGIPQLAASALPVLGASVSLEVASALPNGSAYLIRGFAMDSLPFDGATVWVDYDTVYPLAVDGFGVASLTATVPNSASLAGLSTYWQAWVQNDPEAAGAGWACSAGLELRLGY